jgi:hypothetical protein
MRRPDRGISPSHHAHHTGFSPALFSSFALALLVPIVSIALFVSIISIISSASPARAGSVEDFDGDLIPFEFDNCSVVQNGPNNASNQSDCDGDGYGNACDADYDQDGIVTAADFGLFLGVFGSIFPPQILDCRDHDEDRTITAADFGLFLSQFGGPPGPSNLACANPLLIVPPDPECSAQTP